MLAPVAVRERSADQQLELSRDRVGLLDRRCTVALTLDREPVQSRTCEAGRVDPLPLARRHRVESTLVRRLGDEAADVGMHPPRLREEEPAVSGNRVLTAEQMLKYRSRRTVGMDALRDLSELPRITEQDNVARA